jgi:hypothetical protein
MGKDSFTEKQETQLLEDFVKVINKHVEKLSPPDIIACLQSLATGLALEFFSTEDEAVDFIYELVDESFDVDGSADDISDDDHDDVSEDEEDGKE